MGKYRKLPVEIEAVQFNAADFNGHDWDCNPFNELAPDWLTDAINKGVVSVMPSDTDYAVFGIKTLEGTMAVSPGDYIIRGVKGELYPCKPDIFEATYESVTSTGPVIIEEGE